MADDKKISDLDEATTAAESDLFVIVDVGTSLNKKMTLANVRSEIVAGMSNATTTDPGLMSAADKTKLDGVEEAADVTDSANVATALAGASGALSVNSQRITNVADPSGAQDAATKAYVDAVAQGLSVKASVRVATVGAGTYEVGETVDGVVLAAGDRVLVKNGDFSQDFGIYVVQETGAPVRATDFDADADVQSGAFVFVVEGTVNAGSGWTLITPNPIEIGTTSLEFSQFSGAGQVEVGEGLTKTGNLIDLDPADGSIVTSPSGVAVGVINFDQHGAQTEPSLHAVASGVANGFMSSADKIAHDAHIASTANPHSTSLANIGSGTLAQLNAAISDADVVPAVRTIATTAPLTGGGDMSANRTLAISPATTVAAGSMSAADKTKLDAVPSTTGVDGDLQRLSNAFSVRKHNWAAGGLPLVTDDSSAGYSAGSLWVVPGAGALMCVDASVGAAVWQVITNGDDPPDPGTNIAQVGRANSAGADADYARADHVHDGGLRAVAVKSSDFTLTGTDDVVFIETSGGPVVCGPDAALPSQGRSWVLKKTTSDENAITIQPPPGHSIEGGAADAAYVIPGSRATDNPAFLLVYQGGTTWWVLPHLGNKGELHLRELASDPTNGITDTGILYVKDVGDATHLFYKPNIGAAVQITQAGGLIAHGDQGGGTEHEEATKDTAGFLSAIHYDQLAQGKKIAILFDDEFSMNVAGWSTNVAGAAASAGITAVSGRLSGWLYLSCGTTATGYASLRTPTNIMYGGPFHTLDFDAIVEIVDALPDGTDNYRVLACVAGLSDPATFTGVSFTYDHAVSPNWQATKWAAGVATHTDTGVAVAKDVERRFRWVASGSSSSTQTIEFYIDGALVATLTNCTISATYLHPALIQKTLGALARRVRVDRSKAFSVLNSERV